MSSLRCRRLCCVVTSLLRPHLVPSPRRYNHTFLNNGEAYLGFHLRRSGLRCRDIRTLAAGAAVRLALPSTRKRDWGPHTLGMG